jgi:non-ribosomal peptide synthetase component F
LGEFDARSKSLKPNDVFQSLTVSSSSPDSFTLDVSYRREEISAIEVEVILDHYEMALGFMARHPHANIRDIDFITPDEKRLLLRGLKPPFTLETLLSPVQNVSELIEAQVRRTPHRIAVSRRSDVRTAMFMSPFAASILPGCFHDLSENGLPLK